MPVSYRRAPINAFAAGENAAIAGLTGYRYMIHGFDLVPSAATVVITLKDGTTALSGPMQGAAGVPIEKPVEENAYYETSTGNAFVISVAGAGSVSGAVWYRQL